MSVSDIGSWASMVLLDYQNFIEMTSNMIYTVALGVGFKCPRKIHLNTQWGGGATFIPGATSIPDSRVQNTVE